MRVTSDPSDAQHVHELDAGDAGAYDDEVFWYLLRWVSVAGGEDTFMVDWCPFWDTRRLPVARTIASAVNSTTPLGVSTHTSFGLKSLPVPR